MAFQGRDEESLAKAKERRYIDLPQVTERVTPNTELIRKAQVRIATLELTRSVRAFREHRSTANEFAMFDALDRLDRML